MSLAKSPRLRDHALFLALLLGMRGGFCGMTGSRLRGRRTVADCIIRPSRVAPLLLPGQKVRHARAIVILGGRSWRGSWPSRGGLDRRAGPARLRVIMPIAIRAPVV